MNDTFSVGTGYDTFDDNYDSVVPDNEVLEYLSGDDYLDHLWICMKGRVDNSTI